MSDSLNRALAAAARAFADSLELDLERPQDQDSREVVMAGSLASKVEVLRSIAQINCEQGRGVNDIEVRAIARRAGMDPRGLAGYYSAKLLEKRLDGRWLLPNGRDRLAQLLGRSEMECVDRDSGTSGARGLANKGPHFLLGFGIEDL